MFLLHRNIYYFYIYEFLCFHTHSEVDLRQFRFIFFKTKLGPLPCNEGKNL